MAGPVLKLGGDPEIFRFLGDTNAAAKLARIEIKETEKAIKQLARDGKAIDPELTKRLENAQEAERVAKRVISDRRLTEKLNDLREADRDAASTLRDRNIGRTKEALDSFKALMAGEVARKVMRGEKLEISDVLKVGIASEKFVEKAAERFFTKPEALEKFKRLFAALPVVVEAIAAVKAAIDQSRDERDKVRKINDLAAAGQLTRQERDFFLKIAENRRIIGNAADTAAKALTDTQKVVDTVGDRLLQRFRIEAAKASERGKLEREAEKDKRITEDEILAAIKKAQPWAKDDFLERAENRLRQMIRSSERALGRRLTPEEQKEDIRKVLFEELGLINEKVVAGVLDAMEKKQTSTQKERRKTEQELRREKNREASQSYAEEFMESEKKIVQEYQTQRIRQRTKLDGHIGD